MTVKKSLSNIRDHQFTEDDTFRMLARPGIHDMVKLYKEWKEKMTKGRMTFDSRWNVTFVKKHGWNWVEFVRARRDAGYTF